MVSTFGHHSSGCVGLLVDQIKAKRIEFQARPVAHRNLRLTRCPFQPPAEQNPRELHANSTPRDSHQTASIPQTQNMEKRAVSIGNVNPSPIQTSNLRLFASARLCRAVPRGNGDGQDTFAGRVEHVVSGRAAHFNSARQLTGFMRQVLKAAVDS